MWRRRSFGEGVRREGGCVECWGGFVPDAVWVCAVLRGDSGETFEAVVRGNLRFPTRVFRSVSVEAKDLLRKMICKDVSRRFSAEQILSKFLLHQFLCPWLKSLFPFLFLCHKQSL